MLILGIPQAQFMETFTCWSIPPTVKSLKTLWMNHGEVSVTPPNDWRTFTQTTCDRILLSDS